MKNLMCALALLFLSCVAAPAQCFGVYGPGISPVAIPGGPVALCNNTPGSGSLFVNPNALDITVGGNLFANFSNVPDYAGGPAVFEAYVSLGLGVLAVPGIPLAPGSGCQFYVAPDILLHVDIMTLPVGCWGTFILTAPPIPGLQGIEVFVQGAIRDPLSGGWATSNVSKWTL